MRRLLALPPVIAAVGVSAALAQDPYEGLPACNSASAPPLRLVAPSSLPVGYRGGFYVEQLRDGGRSVYRDFGPVSVAPAAPGGTLRFGYSDPDFKRRDLYLRWPLKFARGDGPARISIPYSEPTTPGRGCRRQLEAVVAVVPTAAPHIRLERPRYRIRNTRKEWHVRATVRGRMRRSARRPVLLVLHQGNAIADRKRVRPRRGRIVARLGFDKTASERVGALRVTANYPGDVSETWPCEDFLSTSLGPLCLKRFHQPWQAGSG